MSFADELYKIPPVTRTIIGATCAVTLPILAHVLSAGPFYFDTMLVTKHWEIWRPFTSFFVGPGGIQFLFGMIMLYRASNNLEEVYYPRRSADYAYQLILTAAGILALNIPLHTPFHFGPFMAAIITLSSLLDPEAQTSLFGLVTFAQKWYPLVLLGLDFVQAGPQAAAVTLTGLIAGYALWVVEWKEENLSGKSAAEREKRRPGSGRVVGRAPEFLRKMIGDQTTAPIASVGDTGAVHVQAPRGRALNDGGQGATAPRQGTNAAGGYNWGSGNRLGTS